MVCAACRADLHDLARRLLEHANAGDRALSPIQGYTLLRELGRGRMGVVYPARHNQTGTEVALKVMLPKVAASAQAPNGSCAKSKHPLAAAPQHRRRAGHRHRARRLLLTLEYCAGGSLDRLAARRGGTLPADDAVRIILQVLHGLEHAHNQGIVHRDLIPHNVLLTGTDRTAIAKIGDFGLGKAFALAGLSSLTRTGTAVGMLG